MQAARRLLAQRNLATLLCAVALLLKLLVPSGYMVDSSHGRIAVTICSGSAPRTIKMEMPGLHGDMPDHGKKDQGRAEVPCAFAGLSAAALGAIDPVQLAASIAFVMAIGRTAVILLAPSPPAYLRPPLRAPPASLTS